MYSRNMITITTETLPLASERAQGVKGWPYTLRVAGYVDMSVLTCSQERDDRTKDFHLGTSWGMLFPWHRHL